MTMNIPAPQQKQLAISTFYQELEQSYALKLLANRVAYLENFFRQKGLSPDEEAVPPVNLLPEENDRKPEATYQTIREEANDPQRLRRDIQAALSQPGNRTPREAELESLLQHTFRCFLTVHAQLQEALQENHWTAKLLAVPATILSPSHKATLYAAAKALQRAAPDGQKLVQIESWNLCKTVGQSKDTFLDNLTYLSEKVGVLRKETQRVVTEDGAYTTNLYIGATDLIAHPERYHVEKPRNHGGARLLCPHCQSDRLQKKVTITCMGCGAVLDEHASQVNKEEAAEPGIPGTVILQKRQVADPDQVAFFPSAQGHLTTDTNKDQGRQVVDSDEQGTPDGEFIGQEPVSPPSASPGVSEDLGELMQNAATLLVEIAGTEPVHIEMSSRGPMKYYEVKRPFGLEDARDHLAGKKTKGAMVRRSDGMTRALCYDADTDDDWLSLREAAHLLASAGYTPLVEDSPVGRGGHLWIIYTDLVDARCAHRHVCELAPMLQTIKEYWPGPGNHKVRLPGGRYVKPGFSQQCKLYDFIGGQVAATRREAARALLTMQTPASIVPAYPPDPAPSPSPGSHPVASPLTGEASRSQQHTPARAIAHGQAARRAQQTNPYHWFHFTPAQLAAWYNERHPLEELRPLEANGMAYSPNGDERTPSMGYRKTPEGERYTDYSLHGRRPDGTRDTGDALELRIRLSGQRKPEVLRQVGRELVREARAALESAASAGHQPPMWVQELLTPAGKVHYQELLLQSAALPTEGALTLAGDLYQKTPLPGEARPSACEGGLTGSRPPHSPAGVPSSSPALQPGPRVSAPYSPPARASYCCHSTAWKWSEAKQQYVCGNCQA